MESFKIGFKTYTIIKQIDERSYKASCGKNVYYIKNFNGDTHQFYLYFDSHKKFDNTGIKHAKIRAKDKKRTIIVIDYIEGENVLSLLSKGELEEKIYEKIFYLAYMAKIERKALNFDPELYRYSNGELYYMSTEWYDFNEENKFINKAIRLWFHTKEFIALCKEKGIETNISVPKDDYLINKQIVLMTCKYFH